MKPYTVLIVGIILMGNCKITSAQKWTLLSPKPTYQSIRSVSFPSVDTGYIVTDDAKVMRTMDSGETWVDLNVQFDALFVEFINNNHGFITAFDKVYSTEDGGETWQAHLIEPFVSCWETYFYNDTVGFAFGWDGYIAKTTDGGISWEGLQSYPGSDIFYYTEMEFADLNTGYAVGQFEHTDMVLRRTDDGGYNWVDIEIPFSMGYVNSVAVLGPDDIWIGVGANAFDSLPCPANVYHSTDGGVSWSVHVVGETFELPDAITRIHFFNQLQGFAMNHRQVYSTFDGGETWNSVYIEPLYHNSIYLGEYSWPDLQHGFIVGGGPSLVKTSDGGLTFTNMLSGTIDRYSIVVFNDSLNGIASGYNSMGSTVIYTEDSGDNWEPALFDSIPNRILDIAFADSYNGWATIGNGLYRSNDGGHSWNILYLGGENEFYRISSPDLNHLFVCGNGSISKSSDGGFAWTDITPEGFTTGYAISAFQFTDTLTGFIAILKVTDNSSRFLKTEDAGLTWTDILFDNNGVVRAMDFCDPLNGIVSLKNGLIYTTHDGGETWIQASITTADYVKMIDAQTAIIALAGTKVAVSHDGGTTFNIIYTNNEQWPYVHDICFLDETHGFAVGYNGMIQRYSATLTGVEEPGNLQTASFQKPFFSPNPAFDRITILEKSFEYISITAMDGSLILSHPENAGNEINISMLKPGIYMVSLHQRDGNIAQKLVKY